MSRFKVGDVVELKSGGPEMTVTRIIDSNAWCTWLHDGNFEEATFPVACLRKPIAHLIAEPCKPI